MAISEEALSLRDTVHDYLTEEVPFSLVRRFVDGQEKSRDTIRSGLAGLGLFELADSGDRSLIPALALLCREAGRALVPFGLSEELAGRFILSRSELGGARPVAVDSVGVTVLDCSVVAQRAHAPQMGCRGGELGASLFADAPMVLILSGEVGDESVASVSGRLPTSVETVRYGESSFALPYTSTVIDRSLAWRMAPPFVSDRGAAVVSDIPARALVHAFFAAELIGVFDGAFALTQAHVTTRRQFDVPVGGFQAVQHGMADLYATHEANRALVEYALDGSASADTDAAQAALMAYGLVVKDSPRAIERMIQLHGGIGFTWEYDLHLYLRRALVREAQWRASFQGEGASVPRAWVDQVLARVS